MIYIALKGVLHMIKIVTDSTSYIPKDQLKQYDISIVSLSVLLNGQNIREVDIEDETFYEELVKQPEIPSSSQPSPHEMYTTFETLLKQGHSILGIFLSSEMSGTYANAQSTKQMLLENYPEAQIEILDSRTNCMQLGFIALAAAKAAAKHQSMEEVLAITHDAISHSRFLFTPDNLTYLKKGGRIGSASALVGTLLQIKPILTVSDGKTSVFTKVRTKKKAIEALITGLMDDLNERDLGDIIVHHINCPQEGRALADRLQIELKRPIQIQSIGPVIGVHVGPGSIGLAYYTIPKQ